MIQRGIPAMETPMAMEILSHSSPKFPPSDIVHEKR